jgi:hypothetical protein
MFTQAVKIDAFLSAGYGLPTGGRTDLNAEASLQPIG